MSTSTRGVQFLGVEDDVVPTQQNLTWEVWATDPNGEARRDFVVLTLPRYGAEGAPEQPAIEALNTEYKAAMAKAIKDAQDNLERGGAPLYSQNPQSATSVDDRAASQVIRDAAEQSVAQAFDKYPRPADAPVSPDDPCASLTETANALELQWQIARDALTAFERDEPRPTEPGPALDGWYGRYRSFFDACNSTGQAFWDAQGKRDQCEIDNAWWKKESPSRPPLP